MRPRDLVQQWRGKAQEIFNASGVPAGEFYRGMASGLDEAANELEDMIRHNSPQVITSKDLTILELTATARHMFHVPPGRTVKAAEDAENGGEGRINHMLRVTHERGLVCDLYHLEVRL